jgi:hypothetical protein
MKNLTPLFVLATSATLSFTVLAGPLDRPGAKATPVPVAPGAVGTNTALAPSVKSLKIMGTVVQKQPNGVVLDPAYQRGKEKPKGYVFVEGDFPKSFVGDKVTCMATDSGAYEYKFSPGAVGEQVRKMTFVRW